MVTRWNGGTRRWAVLAAAVVLALTAAACGGGGQDDEAGTFGQEGDTGGGGSSGGDGVELTILDHQEPRTKLLRELLPEFEKEMADQGKDISVELVEGPAPDDQFQTKATLDFNSGNAADVTSAGYP
ncbi:MAG: hypothetical protein H0T98_01820, partial [Euzebyaceae bacterium]|nr:hypothetical protein [Euzebyaceae bacterium]